MEDAGSSGLEETSNFEFFPLWTNIYSLDLLKLGIKLQGEVSLAEEFERQEIEFIVSLQELLKRRMLFLGNPVTIAKIHMSSRWTKKF